MQYKDVLKVEKEKNLVNIQKNKIADIVYFHSKQYGREDTSEAQEKKLVAWYSAPIVSILRCFLTYRV